MITNGTLVANISSDLNLPSYSYTLRHRHGTTQQITCSIFIFKLYFYDNKQQTNTNT